MGKHYISIVNSAKKILILSALWALPFLFLFVLLFSVYPNYIITHPQSRIFNSIRQVSDSLYGYLAPKKPNYKNNITVDDLKIYLGKDTGLPAKIYQPLLTTKPPAELPEKAYFSKPVKEVAYNGVMVPDAFTTYAPLSGNVSQMVYHNRQQFRYPVDLEKKKNNEIRVFITGGSVAWGSCATDVSQTIAGCMEKGLREKYPKSDIKVITAAANGWSSTQERIWIFNRITEYEPDIIISYSGFNDLYDNYLNKNDLYDRYYGIGGYFRYAIGGFEFYNRGEVISRLGFNDIGSRYHPLDFPRKTLKNISIINAYLKTISIPYIYVLQPKGRVENNPKYYSLYEQLGNEMDKLSKKTGFQFIDHSSLLDSKPEYYADMIHPGDRGYEIIAKDLIAKIRIRPEQ